MTPRGLIECDFCSRMVERAWFYKHGPFHFRAGRTLVDVVPGEMGACLDCSHVMDRRDPVALVDYVQLYIGESQGSRPMLIALYSGFFAHLTGHVTLATSEELKAPPERFHPVHCACGFVWNLDSESYERSTNTRCPRCGTELIVIGKAYPAAAGRES